MFRHRVQTLEQPLVGLFYCPDLLYRKVRRDEIAATEEAQVTLFVLVAVNEKYFPFLSQKTTIHPHQEVIFGSKVTSSVYFTAPVAGLIHLPLGTSHCYVFLNVFRARNEMED